MSLQSDARRLGVLPCRSRKLPRTASRPQTLTLEPNPRRMDIRWCVWPSDAGSRPFTRARRQPVAGVSTDCVQAPTCWCGTCFFRVGYDMSSYIYESGPKRLFLDKMLITHFPNMTSCQNFKGRPKTEYQAAPMTDIDLMHHHTASTSLRTGQQKSAMEPTAIRPPWPYK